MKFFKKSKDGGAESSVTGYWLCEGKSSFSICLLRFDGDSREAYHTHTFHCLSAVLKGELCEVFRDGRERRHKASWHPFLTTRQDFHKVASVPSRTWVLSFRGPWADRWLEETPEGGRCELTHGRRKLPLRNP